MGVFKIGNTSSWNNAVHECGVQSSVMSFEDIHSHFQVAKDKYVEYYKFVGQLRGMQIILGL